MRPPYKIDFSRNLYIFFLISFLILISAFLYNYRKTVALEKRLIKIEEELNSKEISYKKRLKNLQNPN